ncbi:hypothetical protein AOLI_G00220620 [Acnodon oligacanthus]
MDMIQTLNSAQDSRFGSDEDRLTERQIPWTPLSIPSGMGCFGYLNSFDGRRDDLETQQCLWPETAVRAFSLDTPPSTLRPSSVLFLSFHS